METQKYVRKPFYVDAVEVTESNMEEVAKWCDGEVRSMADGDDLKHYIKVRVHRALNDRQTQAFVGDWVLYAGTGYKVYTAKAFAKSFQKELVVHSPSMEKPPLDLRKAKPGPVTRLDDGEVAKGVAAVTRPND